MARLDDPKVLRKHDRSGMTSLIENFPGQCRSAKAIGQMAAVSRSLRRPYRAVICTGLGGSAIGADIARAYLADQAATPLIVNRDYRLPRFAARDTLLVCASYSGNTEETLSAYADGRKKRATVVVITSGGRLKELAERDGCAVVAIPAGLPPRAALGYSFFPLLYTLYKTGIITDPSAVIDEAIDTMDRLRKTVLGPAVPDRRNTAKKLAAALHGRFPVIYAAQNHFDAVATRWRGQLAENAKTLSSAHAFPEMNHNEIMGWQEPRWLMKDAAAVLLRDSGDHPRVAVRMDITKKILRREGVEVLEARSTGKGLLARIFSLVYTGDWVSLYLAALNGVDPTSIDRINYLKKELSRL